MSYLGIDQSLTSSGLVVLPTQGNRPDYMTTIATGKLRGTERLAHIRDELMFVAKKYMPIEQAALEGYSLESVNRSFDLGELGGIIRLFLYDWKIPLVVVPPTSLKKYVTGNGSADKAKVRMFVLSKWGQDIDQDDMCDAYGLAQVARSYPEKLTTNRAELEVLLSLDPKPASPVLQSKGRIKADH